MISLNDFSEKFLVILLAFSPLKESFLELKSSEIHWVTEHAWMKVDHLFEYKAFSDNLVTLCWKNPDQQIVFPHVIHGAHAFSINHKLFETFGDISLNSVRSFYGKPILSCEKIIQLTESIPPPHVFEWKAVVNARYFARIYYSPFFTKHANNLIEEFSHAAASVLLFFLGTLTLLVFRGMIPKIFTIPFALAHWFFALYFFCASIGMFGITCSMQTAHKIADIGLSIGMMLLIFCFYVEGALSKRIAKLYILHLIPSIFIILFATSGDVIQLGITIPFPFTFFLLISSTVKFFIRFLDRKQFDHSFGPLAQAFGLLLLTVAVTNDMLCILGLIKVQMLFPFGIVGGLFFGFLYMSENILKIFQERNDLKENLEQQVAQKTKFLEESMHELKATQAELLQSAKLASLGTLAAGIAHEINNSINYVNGAISPLEKMGKMLPDITAQERFYKLVELMKQGIQLCMQIIKSLKISAGVNQAQMNDVNIKETIDSVLTILNFKIKKIFSISNECDPNHSIFGSPVGISQILLNIIGNSIESIEDANMQKDGKIIITSEQKNDFIIVKVRDNGPGIPDNIKNRIFEPFFTTKPVGKGTGLGLYIVNLELKKHQGKIEVYSSVGDTTFEIYLPKT